jgi:hypothetical protein
MAKQSAEQLNKQLFEMVSKVKLNDPAAIFGTTSNESQLQLLRKNVAELGKIIASKKPYEEIMKAYEAVAADIDTAGVMGLISEMELPEYYTIIDKLWAAIEREK